MVRRLGATFKKLRRAIRNERRGVASSTTMPVHTHGERNATAFLMDLGWEQFDPSTTTSDFRLFFSTREIIPRPPENFNEDDEAKEAVEHMVALTRGIFLKMTENRN